MKFLLASVIVVIWCEQFVSAQDKPWYCGKYDCPPFTSESKGSYEIRTYGPTNWLTTDVVSRDTDASRPQKMSMFWKLFPYFNGQNSGGDKVKMAVPSLTKVVRRSDGKYNITMMFYISQANPPAPNSNAVSIVTRPAGDVYVKEFPMRSMPSKSVVQSKANDLKSAITDKSSFNGDIFYSVAYNYPFTMKMKQYEVWMDKLV